MSYKSLTATGDELFECTEQMLQYGGSFVQQLAACYRYADTVNKRRLVQAFPDYFDEYMTK